MIELQAVNNPYEKAYDLVLKLMLEEQIGGTQLFSMNLEYDDVIKIMNLALLIGKEGGNIETFKAHWKYWKVDKDE